MALRIIALIREGKRDVGFRLYDEVSGAVGNFSIADANIQLRHYGCSNATMENGKLIGLESSIDKFAVVDTKSNIIKHGGVIVLNRIVDGLETKGYTLVNIEGEKQTLTRDEALAMVNKYGVSNASKVTKDGKIHLRGIKKEIPTVEAKDVFKGDEINLKSEAVLLLYAYTLEEDKTKYDAYISLNLSNLSNSDMEKLSNISQIKKKQIDCDLCREDRCAFISVCSNSITLDDGVKRMLDVLNTLKINIHDIVFNASVLAKGGTFDEIASFNIGNLSDCETVETTAYGVTAEDSLQSCKTDLKKSLTKIKVWGRALNKVNEGIEKDLAYLNKAVDKKLTCKLVIAKIVETDQSCMYVYDIEDIKGSISKKWVEDVEKTGYEVDDVFMYPSNIDTSNLKECNEKLLEVLKVGNLSVTELEVCYENNLTRILEVERKAIELLDEKDSNNLPKEIVDIINNVKREGYLSRKVEAKMKSNKALIERLSKASTKEVKQKTAKIQLLTYVKESNKDEYDADVLLTLDGLSKSDVEKLDNIKAKYRGIDFITGGSSARLRTCIDVRTLTECTQQILSVLSVVKIYATSIEWLTGIHYGGDEGVDDIETFNIGNFSKCATSGHNQNGVTSFDNLKACRKDLKEALAIIRGWGKVSEELKPLVDKDLRLLNSSALQSTINQSNNKTSTRPCSIYLFTNTGVDGVTNKPNIYLMLEGLTNQESKELVKISEKLDYVTHESTSTSELNLMIDGDLNRAMSLVLETVKNLNLSISSGCITTSYFNTSESVYSLLAEFDFGSLYCVKNVKIEEDGVTPYKCAIGSYSDIETFLRYLTTKAKNHATDDLLKCIKIDLGWLARNK